METRSFQARSVSELLDAAIGLLKRHYRSLLVLSAIAYIPWLIIGLSVPQVAPGQLRRPAGVLHLFPGVRHEDQRGAAEQSLHHGAVPAVHHRDVGGAHQFQGVVAVRGQRHHGPAGPGQPVSRIPRTPGPAESPNTAENGNGAATADGSAAGLRDASMACDTKIVTWS